MLVALYFATIHASVFSWQINAKQLQAQQVTVWPREKALRKIVTACIKQPTNEAGKAGNYGFSPEPQQHQRQRIPCVQICTLDCTLSSSFNGWWPQVTTASGLKYTDLRVGGGQSPPKGYLVLVDYVGARLGWPVVVLFRDFSAAGTRSGGLDLCNIVFGQWRHLALREGFVVQLAFAALRCVPAFD